MEAVRVKTTESTAAHRLPATRPMGERRVRRSALPTTEGAAAARELPDRSNDGVKVSGTAVLKTKEVLDGAEAGRNPVSRVKLEWSGRSGGAEDERSAAARRPLEEAVLE